MFRFMIAAVFAVFSHPLMAATYTFDSGPLNPSNRAAPFVAEIEGDVLTSFTFAVANEVFEASDAPVDVFFYAEWGAGSVSSDGVFGGPFPSSPWGLENPNVSSLLEASIAPNGDLLSVRVSIDNDRPDLNIVGTSVMSYRFADTFYRGEGTWTVNLDAFVAPVPLPAGFGLLLTALGAFGGLSMRRRSRPTV